MAKLQRGNSELKSRGELSEEMSDQSDDEGPEEVTFDDSKAVALKNVKDARDSVKREKELLKEKRRKRQLLFQEQKKSRLLPEALLEEFETVVKKPPTLPDEQGQQKKKKKRKVKTTKKGPKGLQGNCRVMRVKDGTANTSMQKSAMDFIQARLYGPGTQRTTNAELLSLEKKRGLGQGAAVQFVNKSWGADQKAKAEKCNKRFIHRQKLIST
ncbi:nucleolar protein 7 isoform X2 [Tachysurus vachellii]|uniref:nucleolar protein 7 isoform X2 n=1 Tax=Tachysurus vachellii TaxID=175792 RepID=UPI00296AAB15|nr:nucleolar protein 7 isoform X2 [Tachysurus vachellii]